METAIASHETFDREELLVHNWREEREERVSISGVPQVL